MASTQSVQQPDRPTQARPEIGQILIVIRKWKFVTLTCFVIFQVCTQLAEPRANLDDFSARSADELSLSKGDRVELIERDDEFGDGWYLGRHLVNGNSGLFPQGQYSTPRSCLPQKLMIDSLHKNSSTRYPFIFPPNFYCSNFATIGGSRCQGRIYRTTHNRISRAKPNNLERFSNVRTSIGYRSSISG
jgi:hypothetical protein